VGVPTARRLYPVPSILENIPDNNRIEDELAFLQLTRRFFTVDAISGIEVAFLSPYCDSNILGFGNSLF
jgi:hypothetical protein